MQGLGHQPHQGTYVFWGVTLATSLVFMYIQLQGADCSIGWLEIVVFGVFRFRVFFKVLGFCVAGLDGVVEGFGEGSFRPQAAQPLTKEQPHRSNQTPAQEWRLHPGVRDRNDVGFT